jgi:hypothetical protein
MHEIVNLNIVYSYPVHWSSLKIFRDFIQNFYDAIGYKKFSDEFSYEYCDETLVMKSNDEQVKLLNVRKLYFKKKFDKRKCSN